MPSSTRPTTPTLTIEEAEARIAVLKRLYAAVEAEAQAGGNT
jgi:hypothetical protein